MSVYTKVSIPEPNPPHSPIPCGRREPTVFVHPLAICESAAVGDGTRVWAFAHVMDGAVVGRDCNIGDHAFIETGVRVGDRVTIKNSAMLFAGLTVEADVFIGPGVIFTNDRYPRSPRMAEAATRYEKPENWLTPTYIRQGATIGAGAVLLPGVTIGTYATIGAGAVVIGDVADHRLLVGDPAREVGWVCECGLRLGDDGTCTGCHRRHRLVKERLLAAE